MKVLGSNQFFCSRVKGRDMNEQHSSYIAGVMGVSKPLAFLDE